MFKSPREPVEYDLHGIASVRLIGATSNDEAAVTKQLGIPPMPLTRTPDITIRYVDQVETLQPVRLLGRDDAGFTDDAFLVLRSKHRTGVRVRIPFDQIGQPGFEIVCQSGLPAVPLLIPIINLTALANDCVPVHASAFSYRGVGVVCTGWSKGGKTETLLAFMAQGAQYVGDEWIYIPRGGSKIFGIPEPIRVWDWHTQCLPQLRQRLGLRRRLRLRCLKTTLGMANWTGSHAFDRARFILSRQLYADVRPQDLFGEPACKLSGQFDRLILVGSHDSPDVLVRPIESHEVARRMQHSLSFERQSFMAHYQMFRFAFPELVNPLIEEADALSGDLLLRAFADKPACELLHPYPVSIPALFLALSPELRKMVPEDAPSCQ